MKKIISIILLILNANILFSQNENEKEKDGSPKQPTLIAIYDYEKQAFTTDELRPKHKQPVVLKINNINKLAHNTLVVGNDIKIKDEYLDSDEEAAKTIIEQNKPTEVITSETSSIKVEAPKELETQNDKKNKLDKTEIQEIQATINDNKIKLQKNKNEIDQKNTAISILENDISKLNTSVKEERVNVLQDTANISEFEKDIKTKTESIVDLKQEISILNDTNFNLNLKIEGGEILLLQKNDHLKNFKLYLTKINEKYNELQMNLVNINRINSSYNNYINFIIVPTLTKDQYSKYASEICSILKLDKRNDYYGYIIEFERAYAQFYQQYDAFFNSDAFYEVIHLDQNSAYSKLVKLNLENLKKEVERINKLVNTTELRAKLHNVELFNNVLSGDKAFTVYSNPIQSFQDYLEFKVKITQNKNLGTSILKENDKEFTYTEYVRQGVRWDFSVGTVFDFGIKNQDYEIKSTPATAIIPATTTTPEIPALEATNQIIENSSSEYTPTIAGLLHTSFRSNSMFAFGLSFGASVDLTKLNLNSFFPGVSLLIGKKEKVIFTVGPAFKNVNQLKGIYDTTTKYSESLQIENVTSLKFKTGWFAAISWNLTNKQKSKIIPQK